jgi:Zn-dependent protease with chaperone function
MVRARFFDGRTSQVREVVLSRQAGELALEGEGIALRVPLREVEISEPLARAGRVLVLPDGARCEVLPGPGVDLLLELLGHREGRVSRWQASLRIALASAAVTIALLAAGYRWGLPWLAESVAGALPEEWVQGLGAHTLEALDGAAFEESTLDPALRGRLAARLAALQAPAEGLPGHTLHFRNSALGANAFALPGGEIVVTDALVQLAQSDDEVIGVLAHELGHLRERHALRGLIQASVVGMLVAVWVGDVGTVASALPAFVLEARYSRDFEREADDYAARILAANGLDTHALAELLVRLEASQGGPQARGGLAEYLSSHPATAERIRALDALEAASAPDGLSRQE